MKKMYIMFIIFAALISIVNKSNAMLSYQTVGSPTGLVTASSLNVRQGPGTSFNVITRVNKNEYIRLFAKIGDWYVIQTDSNYIGAVSVKYVKVIYPNMSNNTSNVGEISQAITSELTEDEKEVLNLINSKRVANGLQKLQIDDELQNVSRIKAQDMVDNNYFSHTSPIYGGPFDMLKKFGISYKAAAENIAGNSKNTGAVDAWMNSSSHRANILNGNFNYTGIGIVKSPKYGKIFVEMFMAK